MRSQPSPETETSRVDRRRSRPRFRWIAALAVAGVLAAGFGGYQVGQTQTPPQRVTAAAAAPPVVAAPGQDFPPATRCPAPIRPVRHPHAVCFGAPVTWLDRDRHLLLGYIGLDDGRPLTGARIELLAGRSRPSYTGQEVLSDNAGHFGFVWTGTAPGSRFAFRFPGTPSYASAASAIVPAAS